MSLLVLLSLVLALVVAIWAVMDRSWQLLLLAIAVVLLTLAGPLDVSIYD